MRLSANINKRKFLNSSFDIFADEAVDIKKLVNNVFAKDRSARIGFSADGSAHMGYESYDVYNDTSLDKLLKDNASGIDFKVRIEMSEGIISSHTNNLHEYSFYPLSEDKWSEEEVKGLFKSLLE